MAKLTPAELRAARREARLTRQARALVRSQSRERGQPVTRRQQRAEARQPRTSVWD